MRYRLFFILFLVLIFGACNGGGKKQYKQYQGINYDQYEQSKPRYNDGVINIDGSSVDQTNIDAPDFNIAVDSLGNEVIESTGSNYGEAVVVMAVKKMALSKTASQKDVLAFQAVLDNAYRAAMKQYRTSGFTYAMSPAGAVNPLSVMDVQCILTESSANSKGKDTCDLFFKEASEQLLKMQSPAQN